jgi:hypothetical protein
MVTSAPGGGIAAGNRGSWWLYADAPYGPSGTVDPQGGGIIVERMTLTVQHGSAAALRWTMHAFPTDLVLAPGIPIAVTPDNARFVDPTRSGSEVAPVALYGSNVTPPETGGGPQIHRVRTGSPLATATAYTQYQQELAIFLNWNSALSFGLDPTTVAPAGGVEADLTFFGRIF